MAAEREVFHVVTSFGAAQAREDSIIDADEVIGEAVSRHEIEGLIERSVRAVDGRELEARLARDLMLNL
ncbi:MAG TPA: hypothetical protein VGK73_07330 [Polyangiaceae bacterium]